MFLLAVGLFVAAGDSSHGQIFRRGRPRPQVESRPTNTVVSQPTQEASELISFVREQQRHFVRPSFSETNCFTWIDLRELKMVIASDEANKLINADKLIKDDPKFKTVVESLKQLSPAQRTSAYNAALRIRRPTWREMGFIDPQGRGQTEAGQQADILIGREVVRLVREAVGG